jgi:general L-amino acid transport system ATP-binding protein
MAAARNLIDPKTDIVVAEGIHKSFDGVGALNGVDLRVKKGEVVVIIGPSGSGKSTFIRTLNRLEEIEAGTITIDSIKLESGANLEAIRREVGMVSKTLTSSLT